MQQKNKLAKSETQKLFLHDQALGGVIAGCDEAGRGPLAGPVVCAACIMPMEKSAMLEGINDSKQISEKKREILFDRILDTAIDLSISVIECEVIDKINILQATKRGMSEAIAKLKVTPNLVLVDAVSGLNTTLECRPIIKGDATSYNIAAASIIAKVTRDRIMRELDLIYPNYLFAKNKGYGTREHIEALRRFGATPVHRKLFVASALTEQLSFNL